MQQEQVTPAISLREKIGLGIMYILGSLVMAALAVQLYFVYVQRR